MAVYICDAHFLADDCPASFTRTCKAAAPCRTSGAWRAIYIRDHYGILGVGTAACGNIYHPVYTYPAMVALLSLLLRKRLSTQSWLALGLTLDWNSADCSESEFQA